MTTGHRYELHKSSTHETDEQGRRYRWCIYDYFNVCGQSGLSFWYFTTRQDALARYPEASTEFAPVQSRNLGQDPQVVSDRQA